MISRTRSARLFPSLSPLTLAALGVLTGCAAPRAEGPRTVGVAGDRPGQLLLVASSAGHQWTGLAVGSTGRLFVNYPRWSGPHRLSVAELVRTEAGLEPRAFPDESWNREDYRSDPSSAFVCVQSVVTDERGHLWILDPASPGFAGVVPGGAKLVQVEIATGRVVRVYGFDAQAAPEKSYLNDVRIEPDGRFAYITDSGLGALLVLDLASGRVERLLEDHVSTKAEPIVLTIGGRAWRLPDGTAPAIHSDGIALDAERGWLYFAPLTARTLYRIPTAALRNPAVRGDALASRVERLWPSVATDGLEVDGAGNVYLSALEEDAVFVRTPEGEMRPLVKDPRLAWPDSFAFRAGTGRGTHSAPRDGRVLWFTTAQIHRTPPFAPAMPAEPFGVWSVPIGR